MSGFDRLGSTLDKPARHRPGSRFGDLGDRLARTFGTGERNRPRLADWDNDDEFEFDPYAGGATQALPRVTASPGRFPPARNGYDRACVDKHIESLERELEELRSHRADAVESEIDRIGEQTAVILRTAHRQAQDLVHDARSQADRCVQDAAANAIKITEQAKERLRSLDSETDTVWQERARLLEDARGVATSLFTLVEEALERFPAEVERVVEPAPAPVAPAPVAAADPAAVMGTDTPAPAQAPSAPAAEEHQPEEHQPDE